MLGLDTVMSAIVERLQRVELQTSNIFRQLLVCNVLLSECPQNISPLTTFAINVIVTLYRENGSLLTAQAFTSIALINLLTVPVMQLVQISRRLLGSDGLLRKDSTVITTTPNRNKP
ncbi:hypothetical protein ACQRIU_006285 [Beauveria bassiana]